MSDEDKFTAPYVPFRTFETALDSLATLGGIPPKIDHSVFPNMGGVQRGQVLSAFKFLGLTDATGNPKPLLKELALKKEGRKTVFRTIIKECYPNISESDLSTMSPEQLDSKLSDKIYNVGGATKTKARSFLLKAAQHAGLQVSLLLSSKGPRGPRKKRSTGSTQKANNGTPAQEQTQVPPELPKNVKRMPIPLGPDRLAYIELPKDWEPRELKKLLALLRLSLAEGDDIPSE